MSPLISIQELKAQITDLIDAAHIELHSVEGCFGNVLSCLDQIQLIRDRIKSIEELKLKEKVKRLDSQIRQLRKDI